MASRTTLPTRKVLGFFFPFRRLVAVMLSSTNCNRHRPPPTGPAGKSKAAANPAGGSSAPESKAREPQQDGRSPAEEEAQAKR